MTNPRVPVALALTLLAAGCGLTTEGSAIREFVKVEGAGAYDEGLLNSEWFICRAASVGSVLRRYGQSVEKAEGWRALCLGDPEAMRIVGPAPISPLEPIGSEKSPDRAEP